MRLIFSFGCPRSGTTLLKTILGDVTDSHQKISEGSPFHPCQSDLGLLDIRRLFRDHETKFVRIVRDPMQVAESFVAARSDVFGDEMEGLRKHSDQKVVEFVLGEFYGVNVQREALGDSLVELSYDMMSNEEYPAYAEEESGIEGLARAIRDRWGQPVRPGRLSHGVEVEMTPAQRHYFSKSFSPIYSEWLTGDRWWRM